MCLWWLSRRHSFLVIHWFSCGNTFGGNLLSDYYFIDWLFTRFWFSHCLVFWFLIIKNCLIIWFVVWILCFGSFATINWIQWRPESLRLFRRLSILLWIHWWQESLRLFILRTRLYKNGFFIRHFIWSIVWFLSFGPNLSTLRRLFKGFGFVLTTLSSINTMFDNFLSFDFQNCFVKYFAISSMNNNMAVNCVNCLISWRFDDICEEL